MTTLDCRTCGACCRPEDLFSIGPGYVALHSGDVERLPDHYRKLHVVQGRHGGCDELALKDTEHTGRVCVALHGTIGDHVTCEIYDERPVNCRTFRPGSDECLNARHEADLPT